MRNSGWKLNGCKHMKKRMDSIKAPINLDFPEGKLEAEIFLPKGQERLVVLAYKMLGISSEVADMAALAASKYGHKVSCQKGCGACCSQLVPLSPPEAAMIYEFVSTMAESQKSAVLKGFSSAIRRLERSNLLIKLESLQNPSLSEKDYDAIALEYFKENVACPFLVNQSCSIHEVRPSMCREYLVISPAENCKDLESKQVSRLPVSLRLSEALARTWAIMAGQGIRIIPLILAIKWVAENESVRTVSGDSMQLLKLLLGHISEIVNKRATDQTAKR